MEPHEAQVLEDRQAGSPRQPPASALPGSAPSTTRRP
jgi:hypothetical protein